MKKTPPRKYDNFLLCNAVGRNANNFIAPPSSRRQHSRWKSKRVISTLLSRWARPTVRNRPGFSCGAARMRAALRRFADSINTGMQVPERRWFSLSEEGDNPF